MNDRQLGIILTVFLCASFGRAEAIKKDIVFLMDTSGSITNSDVLQAVDFIYNVTKWLTIGPDNIRVSVVTFDSTYQEKFKLKDYSSSAELLQNLKRQSYSKPGGGTVTDAALEFVRLNSFLPNNGGRPDAKRAVVLLTDGQSSFPNETLTQAELLKSIPNTELFTIGIGSASSESNGEIRGISSDPDSYYVQQVGAFIYLCNVVPALVPKLDALSKARAILNCPTPTTTTPSMNSSHLWWRSSTTTKTTRATPHQQIGAMSSAKTITNSDVNNNHAERKDIVFLVDTSGSIANSDVLQAVDFIYNVTKWLTIGPDNIRVSVVTFDSTYQEKFKLKDYSSSAELLQNLKRQSYSKPGGGTVTDAALEFVRLNSFLPNNGGRPDAKRAVVLLTDGQSSFPNETLTQAESLKSIPNTEIFTIGIGSASSESNGEIRGISSDPDSYYVQQVGAFIYLCNLVPALVAKFDALSKARAILNCPTPTTTTPSMNSSHLWWRSSTTTKTTRATPRQQIGAMSSAKTITNSDVNNNHAERKDIVFLVDTSGSITNSDVLQAVDFIYNVTKWLTIGPDNIRVSVVTFDSTYQEKFKLKDYSSSAELLQNLKRQSYSKPGGGTVTDAALEFVRLNSFLPNNGGRPDAKRAVVLLTDGQSSFPNETLTQAESLKSIPNTEIFTIGIGSASSESNGEIRGISSDPDSYYVQQVGAFIYLCNVVPALVPKLDPLSKARAILNCPTPTTTTPSMNSSHLWWRSSTTTKTTRATPHQQIGAMSSAKTITNSDVNNNHAERKDIVFLVDTSGSIANSDVLQAVDFIYNVTKWLTIGPDNIRVSVVTFDSTYQEKFKLKDYSSSAELLQNLKRQSYSKPGGGTVTDAALEFVRLNSFLPNNGGRPDAKRAVVLLTDGQSSFPNETLTQAESLKSIPNTEIFTIGIGSASSESNGEIRGISSDPDSYYVQQVGAFIYLCNVVPALVPKLDPLSKARAILNCPTPTTTTPSLYSSHLWWRLSTTTKTTRATPHQQIGTMSIAERMTSRDVNDSETKGEVNIAMIVGVVLAGLVLLVVIGGGVIRWKRANHVSPSKGGQSDVPWTRQYNEAKEGQLNTKFNPASLRY